MSAKIHENQQQELISQLTKTLQLLKEMDDSYGIHRRPSSAKRVRESYVKKIEFLKNRVLNLGKEHIVIKIKGFTRGTLVLHEFNIYFTGIDEKTARALVPFVVHDGLVGELTSEIIYPGSIIFP